EVKHIIQCAPLAGLANVFLHKLEPRIVPQMLNVDQSSSQKIIRRDHLITLAQQPIAQMRSQKTCPSRQQRTSRVHGSLIHCVHLVGARMRSIWRIWLISCPATMRTMYSMDSWPRSACWPKCFH